MARFRVLGPARADLVSILSTSEERWGTAGRRRNERLLLGAFRLISEQPRGPTIRSREELASGVRSLHTRHVRVRHGVKHPVHVVYFRVAASTTEIVRVLHERMDPALEPRPTSKRRKP